jgi:hypothetical protein
MNKRAKGDQTSSSGQNLRQMAPSYPCYRIYHQTTTSWVSTTFVPTKSYERTSYQTTIFQFVDEACLMDPRQTFLERVIPHSSFRQSSIWNDVSLAMFGL